MQLVATPRFTERAAAGRFPTRADRDDGNRSNQPQPSRLNEPSRAVPETPAAADLDARLVRLYRRYAMAAAVAAIAIGGFALLGCIAELPVLASLNPAWVAMKVNTAICLVLAGLGLFLAVPNGHDRPARRVAVQACAVVVAAIGLATLAEFVLGRDFGIDQILIPEPPGATGTLIPGRMALPTAVSCVLLGAAVLLHAAKRDGFVSAPLNLFVFFSSVLVLDGYFLGAEELYKLADQFTAVALPTALALLLISGGLLVIDPRRGLLRWLASPRSGGVMLRRLLPIVTVLPITIAWLRLQGQTAGIFSTIEFGSATVAVANLIALCCVLFWAATQLDRSDAARLHGEALRVAAQYARSLIEASLDPLIMISDDGKITNVNKATEEATGRPRSVLIGTDFDECFTEPDKARAGHRQVLSDGFAIDYPLALQHASGKTTDVLYNASVYRDETGAVAGVFAAARDITERKQAEEELARYREHLEELVAARTADLAEANGLLEVGNKELEAFSYSVSHDLRTPLRAIDGFSLILLEDHTEKLDAEGKRVLNVVRGNTKKMSQLIDDILAFSRTGRQEMAVGEVEMERVVREAIEELESASSGRDIAFEIAPLPALNVDPAMLRRVFVNLIDNAVKFTAPKAKAVIEIGARSDGREFVFSIKDNGVGFDMQYVGKLFGVFQRLHGPEEFFGTGIELAIVKRIVSRHGGRVWAEGKPGEGATFYFTLPITEKSDA